MHACPLQKKPQGARRDLSTFAGSPDQFDVVVMNPPFGGKEGKEAHTRFACKTGATQILFLQHVIDALKLGGRCGMVIDEGVLFRTTETAFVQTKRKLLPRAPSSSAWPAVDSVPKDDYTCTHD